MAQARRSPAKKTTSSQESPSNLSGDQKPKSGDDWAPETVEPGAPEPVMDDANPDLNTDDNASDSEQDDNPPQNAQNRTESADQPSGEETDDTDQNQAAKGEADPTGWDDGVDGLGIGKSDADKQAYALPVANPVEPEGVVVVEDRADVVFDGQETQTGGIVPNKDIVLKVFPMNSKVPTYVVLFPAGIEIPKHRVEAYKARAQSSRRTAKDEEQDQRPGPSEAKFAQNPDHPEMIVEVPSQTGGGLATGSPEADKGGNAETDVPEDNEQKD